MRGENRRRSQAVRNEGAAAGELSGSWSVAEEHSGSTGRNAKKGGLGVSIEAYLLAEPHESREEKRKRKKREIALTKIMLQTDRRHIIGAQSLEPVTVPRTRHEYMCQQLRDMALLSKVERVRIPQFE